MNKRLKVQLLAALSVAAVATMPTSAFADKGDRGEVFWNPSDEAVPGIIQAGNTVCDGSKWQNTCYTWSRVSNEVMIHYTSRQRRGVGTNFGSFRLVRQETDDAGNLTGNLVMYDESGQLLTTLSKTVAVENGPARMYQVFSAAFNGFAGGIAGPLVCTIAGCNQGNGGGTAIAVSNSLADALAGAEGNFNIEGGCPPGSVTCSGAPPAHVAPGTVGD